VAEFDVTTGLDTWVYQGVPAQNNSTGRFPAIQAGGSYLRPLMSMPIALSAISGRTVLAATLSVPVQGFWVSQTVTAQALAASWNVATVNANNAPGVTGATASSGATGALAPGQRFEIDMTALIQAIADGQPNYGWRFVTSQSTSRSTIRGFDSGLASWTLHVEVSDLLSKPADLRPQGVIGLAKPILLVDDVEDLSQVQVQIDADPSPISPDFDSGWVTVTKPQLDLSATAYGGLSDGASTFWRTRLKTLNGSFTAWSDWVSIERDDKPAIVMDNPSGTDLWDPTPTIAAHLSPSGDADTRWQVIVHTVGDATDVRYNSGDALAGAALAHTIPLRWKGRKVFPTDGDYRLIVKAWDRSDRAPSPGDTAYVREALTVTLDADGTVTAPNSITLSQATSGYPDVIVGWTRASDPDFFTVWRDGEIIRRLAPDDVRVSPGVFEWTDPHAAPNVTHNYKVRAVTDVSGTLKQSAFSPDDDIFAKVLGIWLRWDGYDVVLDGPDPNDPGIDAEQFDKRQTFELIYRAEDIDIITAVGGYRGTFGGTIDRRQDDLEATAAALNDLRQNSNQDVRLVWFTQNIPIDLKSLSVAPSKEVLIPFAPAYEVKFGFSELPEPDSDD
jgi:hypothetical protein